MSRENGVGNSINVFPFGYTDPAKILFFKRRVDTVPPWRQNRGGGGEKSGEKWSEVKGGGKKLPVEKNRRCFLPPSIFHFSRASFIGRNLVSESFRKLSFRCCTGAQDRVGVARCWFVFTYKFQPNSHYPLTDPAAQTGRRNPFETATYVTRFEICLHARHRVIRLCATNKKKLCDAVYVRMD